MNFGGIFDYESKSRRLAEVQGLLEDPDIWSDAENAAKLGQEKVQLETFINSYAAIEKGLEDSASCLEWLQEEMDADLLQELQASMTDLCTKVEGLEFQRMFSGELDSSNAYLDVQAGSGGTEAQDWAEMLLRMFLRFADKHGFKAEILEVSAGEVAGIKSATVHIIGDHAYGWLRTETGVHRLVRKSPFDSGNRRHTSFASVFVSAEIDDNIEVDINPADLRIDTYRSSGAGGQHVNKTDSAVRITHEPSGIVVQCQNDRSQHKNKAQAMKQLLAKLYEMELQERQAAQASVEASKADIGWGSQIRSYVLDQSRVKDLRTGMEHMHPQTILDGDLDVFIVASLKHLHGGEGGE